MTTFLLNSLGRDRPRSDPLFIKIYAMDSCRVDGVRFLVCYWPLATEPGILPAFLADSQHLVIGDLISGHQRTAFEVRASRRDAFGCFSSISS